MSKEWKVIDKPSNELISYFDEKFIQPRINAGKPIHVIYNGVPHHVIDNGDEFGFVDANSRLVNTDVVFGGGDSLDSEEFDVDFKHSSPPGGDLDTVHTAPTPLNNVFNNW